MRRAPSTSSAPQASAPELKVRFVAKGCGHSATAWELSAESLGRVLGVSAQSVYNWDSAPAPDRK